jgi:hypothetical protein
MKKDSRSRSQNKVDKPLKVDRPGPLELNQFFVPRASIQEASARLFVGRKDALEHAIARLSDAGSSLVVYGDRGAGKTSFARMLMHALGGSSGRREKAAKDLGISAGHSKAEAKLRYMCVWREVQQHSSGLEDVLYFLLDPSDCGEHSFARQFPEAIAGITEEYRKLEPNQALAPRGEASTLNPTQKRLHHLFERAESLIAEHYPEVRPVFFFDEVDLLDHRTGLGQLLKHRSSSFVITGIGSNVADLVADHLSVQRKISEYQIARFSEAEVRELFLRAQKLLNEHGYRIQFQPQLIQAVYDDSSGQPSRCHYIGAAILTSYRDELESGKEIRIGRDEYLRVIQNTGNEFVSDYASGQSLDRGLTKGNARWSILVGLGKNPPEGAAIESLDLPTAAFNYRDQWTNELVEDGILSKDLVSGKHRFASLDLWIEVRRRIRTSWQPGSI